MDLVKYSRDITSQYGEDGIIEKIIDVIGGEISKYSVEFGAWDGKHLSNTWNLIHNHHWSGCYIEGDADRYAQLNRLYLSDDRITCIHAMVADASDSKNCLSNLLKNAGAPNRIGLLSIDIDGNDYAVWRDFSGFDVDIVCIEFNPTLPPNLEYVDEGGRAFMGSSALSLTKLAQSKGYELVACTFSNCIYVRREYFPLFDIENNSVEKLMPMNGVTYLCRNFAGEVVLSNKEIVAPMIGLIVYKSPRKWVKLILRRIKSFRFLNDSYPG